MNVKSACEQCQTWVLLCYQRATATALMLNILDTGLSDAAALLLQVHILPGTVYHEVKSLSSIPMVSHSFSVTMTHVFC